MTKQKKQYIFTRNIEYTDYTVTVTYETEDPNEIQFLDAFTRYFAEDDYLPKIAAKGADYDDIFDEEVEHNCVSNLNILVDSAIKYLNQTGKSYYSSELYCITQGDLDEMKHILETICDIVFRITDIALCLTDDYSTWDGTSVDITGKVGMTVDEMIQFIKEKNNIDVYLIPEN